MTTYPEQIKITPEKYKDHDQTCKGCLACTALLDLPVQPTACTPETPARNRP